MQESPVLTIRTSTASLSAAHALIEAALSASSAAGVEIAVAVVDAGGNLKAFSRSDSAPFLTVEASINKAWTAASFGLPTHVWNEYLADSKLAPLASLPRLLAVGGGCPIRIDGVLVGAIGVSGGSYDQDQAFAEAALASVGFNQF
ncbi:heme-binding protein [Citrobacter freundii]|uniref:GlcG/HbpS family heme-binding protein n=1 Tax=Citrobacter freundii TaxID=546 RepID=UPI0008FD7FC5|nr:heme-binding protein [Citrobacter freundii]EKW7211322.1 heme-binding protein [Citrobacter freundii]ELO0987935.1 heme-binding protein [Citrobacter freundii]MDE8800901.1 heme-binding protein [Citrobacter freundii]MDE8806028.1 heme-binding protein [Citrobacter freundii]OIZ44209.1 hypothetical protein BEH73_16495 [Citrobacter freundii]